LPRPPPCGSTVRIRGTGAEGEAQGGLPRGARGLQSDPQAGGSDARLEVE